MKPVKFILLPLLFVGILLVSISCKKEKPQEPEITYYDVIGVGYVFMCDTLGNLLYPAQDAKILVSAFWGVKELPVSTKETLTTDETGKYCVRFAECVSGYDVIKYRIYLLNYIGSYVETSEFEFSSEDIKNVKHTILLDTIKTRNGYFR